MSPIWITVPCVNDTLILFDYFGRITRGEDRIVTFEPSVPWVHLLGLLTSDHEAQICNDFSGVVCGY